MDNLMEIDLYELIGTVITATIKDIKTAYRKKALSCHPDKNPDNPKAAELFHQLSRALEILTDESARKAYDKVLNAKYQAKIRTKQLDAKRQKLKEDLEAREEAHRKSQIHGRDNRTDEQRLQAEIERLRTMGSKQVEEEVAFVRQQVFEEMRKMRDPVNADRSADPNEHRVKIKWKVIKGDQENGGYDHEILHRILSKYGDITILVVSSNKKGRALVEYNTKDAAEMAIQIEQGLSSNPITLEWVCKPNKSAGSDAPNMTGFQSRINSTLFPVDDPSISKSDSKFPSYSSAPDIFKRKVSDMEFESSVLSNLRRAEERKRLIEKLNKEDDVQLQSSDVGTST